MTHHALMKRKQKKLSLYSSPARRLVPRIKSPKKKLKALSKALAIALAIASTSCCQAKPIRIKRRKKSRR